MEQIHHDSFDHEITCTYRDETYIVRDNGTVFRHRRNGARIRPLDEKWTFGSPRKDGYMFVSSIQVHRIVATAFHGPEPSEAHIVDHIDTNRQNNRPENLRWGTRLENILRNPISARRVEIAYGSIENFLKNPDRPISGKLNPDFEWMRSVTKKQAEESYRSLLEWAKSRGMPSGGTLGEWLYTPRNEQYVEEPEPDDLIESRTPSAIQKKLEDAERVPTLPIRYRCERIVRISPAPQEGRSLCTQ